MLILTAVEAASLLNSKFADFPVLVLNNVDSFQFIQLVFPLNIGFQINNSKKVNSVPAMFTLCAHLCVFIGYKHIGLYYTIKKIAINYRNKVISKKGQTIIQMLPFFSLARGHTYTHTLSDNTIRSFKTVSTLKIVEERKRN